MLQGYRFWYNLETVTLKQSATSAGYVSVELFSSIHVEKLKLYYFLYLAALLVILVARNIKYYNFLNSPQETIFFRRKIEGHI